MPTSPTLDRRGILKAAAWSAPVLTVATAAPALAASPQLRSVVGELTWGVKRSFRNYIINVPISQGTITLSGGVTQTGGAAGIFTWPNGAGTVAPDGTVSVQFEGSVRFLKHEGQLDVTIAKPLITVNPDGTGTITVTHTTPEGTTTPVVANLTSVTTTDGTQTLQVSNGNTSNDVDSAVTSLAETGVPVFAGEVYGQYTEFYDAGDPMNAFATTLTVV